MTEAASHPFVPRPRRGLPTVVLIVVIVVVLAGVVASRINLNYYVLSPGDAQSVGPLIKVPPGRAHHSDGSVFLTDVLLAQVTALSYLPDRLSGDNQLVPSDEIVSSGVPPSELDAQGYLEMVQSKSAAKTAALRRLGYPVPERNAGVVVEAVGSGTPALGILRVGQVVTAVDGVQTATLCAFVGQLARYEPGQSLRLSVDQNHFSPSGELETGANLIKTVRLNPRPDGTLSISGCPGVRAGRGFLGISVATQQDFTFPFPITINTADIGGPSAGLAMTLGLLNTLSDGDLTGGRKVAATGTIDPAGDVGDVGGVAQKTIAVERAGASVFFVPTPELAAALSKATPTLHVYAVNTLAQALSILKRLGGHVPDPTSTQ
jgi:Lon-like protease